MKNAVAILLFLAIVVGGGYWLTSETVSEVSTTDPATVSTSNDKLTAGPTKKITVPKEPAKERPEPASKGPYPKVVADELEFDFGRMVVGTERDHVFVLRNEGESDLELQAGKPTCKCTKFELSRQVVPPGETAELTIRWEGKFKEPKFAHGGRIYSNDPKLKEFGIRVVGIVDQPYDLLPSETWNVPGDNGRQFEGFILSRVYDDFEVTELTCDSPMFETELTKLTPERIENLEMRAGVLSGYSVRVSVKPDMTPGLLESKIGIKLDKSDVSMTIDLRAKKEGPIRILPQPGLSWSDIHNGLGLGRFRATDGRKASLILLVDHTDLDEALEFTSVECEPAFIKAELDADKAGSGKKRRYFLNITIPPGVPPMIRNRENPALISIKTNHPSGQGIDIKMKFVAF